MNVFNYGGIKTVQGAYAVKELGSEVKRLKGNKVLLVTDQGICAAGQIAKSGEESLKRQELIG